MTLALRALVARGALVLAVASCQDDACTEIGCSDTTVITYPVGLVDGPYDLDLVAETGSWHARCLGAPPPEGPPNDEGLDCDRDGFELEVPPGTSARTLVVTIVDVDTQTTLLDAVAVAADAVGEDMPNGPGCEPTCFVRNGQVPGG
ncbi:MAG: hypothetical protein K1X88_31780 [Nannocystaceae bacterium]|nr:hypothetical protein [Nannocystaceae bacterium]